MASRIKSFSLRSPKKRHPFSCWFIMLTFACLLAVVAVVTAGPVSSNDNLEHLTQNKFISRLNHFRPQDGRLVNFVST